MGILVYSDASALFERCGLGSDCYMDPADDRTIIRYHGDLTFEMLEKISAVFGTKRIDLGIDTGC